MDNKNITVKKNDKSRKKIREDRVKTIMRREGLDQKNLAYSIGMEPSNFSRSVRSYSGLSDKTCRKIANKFPQYYIGWILGDSPDDMMLLEDFQKKCSAYSDATNNATIQILDSALREVCSREGIDTPVLDNIPELLLLQAQIRDFADSLMWNYVKHREHSHVWSYLDQIGEK